jgi:hypothetical protein
MFAIRHCDYFGFYNRLEMEMGREGNREVVTAPSRLGGVLWDCFKSPWHGAGPESAPAAG